MSVTFQGDMLKLCDFIQVYVFTTNHHLESLVIQLFIVKGGYANEDVFQARLSWQILS